jgi:hypothetical protein
MYPRTLVSYHLQADSIQKIQIQKVKDLRQENKINSEVSVKARKWSPVLYRSNRISQGRVKVTITIMISMKKVCIIIIITRIIIKRKRRIITWKDRIWINEFRRTFQWGSNTNSMGWSIRIEETSTTIIISAMTMATVIQEEAEKSKLTNHARAINAIN